MAAEDTEVMEKPVREQLKKASIGNSEEARKAADEVKMVDSDSEVPGEALAEDAPRLQKKRSFDDVEAGEAQATTAAAGRHHTRKRSRDNKAQEEDMNGNKRKNSGERTREPSAVRESATTNGVAKSVRAGTPERAGEKRPEDAVEDLASPKLKRTRIQPETTDDENLDVPSSSITSDLPATDSKDDSAKLLPTSGFANSSATSPFSALAGSKSPDHNGQPQTSASAFASSGFGALAGSSTAGFGAVGKSSGGFGSGGGFGTGSKSPLGAATSSANDKPAVSSFGGALGQRSAFASSGNTTNSGFGGKLGQSTGFGSAFGSGSAFGGLSGSGGLTSFASGKPAASALSAKPSRSFGSPLDDAYPEAEGEDEGDDAGYKPPLSSTSDHKDDRFYAQDIETGEEDEQTQYTARAKLYTFGPGPDGGKKEWRERGLGVLKLNVKHLAAGEDDTKELKPKARFLMRADGSHRVVLNSPITKELKFAPPKNGMIAFLGTAEGAKGLETMQLKMRQQFAIELHERITELQEVM